MLHKTQWLNAAQHLHYLNWGGGGVLDTPDWKSGPRKGEPRLYMPRVAAAEAARTGYLRPLTGDDDDDDTVAYSPEVAAASWEGTGMHSTLVPNLFLGGAIQRVLKQVHPDTEISKVGQRIVSDLIACTVDVVLAVVDGLPGGCNQGCTSSDQFATVHTNAFLEDDSAKKVLASRLSPRDEVWVHHADDDTCSWELRSEVVRVGLADTLASFEAKTAAEQEADFKAQQDFVDADPLARDGGETNPHDLQTALRRVFPFLGALYAAHEAIKKFSGGDSVSFKDGKVQYSGNLTAASDVDDVNTAISHAAGLQVSVLEIAHAMHARLGNPPSLTAAVYLAAAMEYLAAKILELSGNAARDCKSSWILPRHLQLALGNDEELNLMFENTIILDGGVVPHIHTELVDNFDAGEGSDYFVSGTRQNGDGDRDGDEIAEVKRGLREDDIRSVGANWVYCAQDGGEPFTTLSEEDQAALFQPSAGTLLTEQVRAKRDSDLRVVARCMRSNAGMLRR